MKFPLSAAAAQVEDFEALNEGIWITEAALQNIEGQLSANQATVTDRDAAVATLSTELGTANASVANLNETITARDARIAELEARVTELEATTVEFEATSRQTDDLGTGKVSYAISDENPINKIADSVMPVRNK
jgi:chromosome segregation ATPase